MSGRSGLATMLARIEQEKRDRVQEQLANGSLTIRKATERERREWDRRKQEITANPALVNPHSFPERTFEA
ncbi:MAG: hypothetical protein M3355_11840 [Actinomycetota bacterium]|nr:hypothetical protein [Actinomycetota bacterium]